MAQNLIHFLENSRMSISSNTVDAHFLSLMLTFICQQRATSCFIKQNAFANKCWSALLTFYLVIHIQNYIKNSKVFIAFSKLVSSSFGLEKSHASLFFSVRRSPNTKLIKVLYSKHFVHLPPLLYQNMLPYSFFNVASCEASS